MLRSKFFVASVMVAGAALAADKYKEDARLADSATVFSEVMNTPDKGIPQDLLGKAHCVVIIPGVKKAAFIVGAEFGRGFEVCRKAGGVGWGNPAAVKMEGGSIGPQVGGSETDLILLVMNHGGMRKLLSDKFTLGADATVAAGPVGRNASASTDVEMRAEILAWSRSRGLFAGLALKGGTLRPDVDGNAEIYGSKMGNREIMTGSMPTPHGAEALKLQLDRYSAFSGSDYSLESQ